MLLSRDLGPLTAEQADALERSRDNARALLELISATLDLARLDAGRDTVDLAPVVVGGVLSELRAELEPLARDGVVLRWHDATGATPLITDRAKLKTIVKNLVGNALKFTDAGIVEAVVERTRDGLRCTVRDTGIGIPAAQLPYIFEQFHQLDGSSTRRHGGVGLGLHIVHRLVGLLHGDVTVESTPGVGSRFTVVLPAEPVAVAA
jgi:signal transduction histidine kinase